MHASVPPIGEGCGVLGIDVPVIPAASVQRGVTSESVVVCVWMSMSDCSLRERLLARGEPVP